MVWNIIAAKDLYFRNFLRLYVGFLTWRWERGIRLIHHEHYTEQYCIFDSFNVILQFSNFWWFWICFSMVFLLWHSSLLGGLFVAIHLQSKDRRKSENKAISQTQSFQTELDICIRNLNMVFFWHVVIIYSALLEILPQNKNKNTIHLIDSIAHCIFVWYIFFQGIDIWEPSPQLCQSSSSTVDTCCYDRFPKRCWFFCSVTIFGSGYCKSSARPIEASGLIFPPSNLLYALYGG